MTGPAAGEAVTEIRRARISRAAWHCLVATLALALLALGLVVTVHGELGAEPARLRSFLRLFIEDRPIAAAGVLVVLIAAAAADRLVSATAPVVRFLDERPGMAALLALPVLAGGALLVSLAHPFAADEAAMLFQAKVFAAGRTMGQIPPDLLDRAFGPGHLGFFYIADPRSGHVVANYWPGFSLLLAPFALARVPFLLNPVVAAATMLLVHRLTRTLYPTRPHAAGWAVLFVLASPAFVINATSYYAMPAHLLANATFALLLLAPGRNRAIAAGLVGGYALLLHHPYAHALFALPWLVWLALIRRDIRATALVAAGYALALLAIGGFWINVQGGLTPPAGATAATAGGIEGILRTIEAVFRLPGGDTLFVRFLELTRLVVWSAPGLIVLAALGAFDREIPTGARLLVASAAVTVAGYLIVFFDQGAGWSSRYFHPVWAVLPVLAAGAVTRPPDPQASRVNLPAFAGALALLSGLLLNAAAAGVVRSFMSRHVAQLPAVDPGHAQLVVLHTGAGDYVHELVRNDPFLRGPVIYLRGDGSPADDAFVRSAFPAARLVRRGAIADVWFID